MFEAFPVVKKSVCIHALYSFDDASGSDSSSLWIPETFMLLTKWRASQTFSTKLHFSFLAAYFHLKHFTTVLNHSFGSEVNEK